MKFFVTISRKKKTFYVLIWKDTHHVLFYEKKKQVTEQ